MRSFISIAIVVSIYKAPNFVFCWHAFMGQEAVPTLPKSNLDSSLNLPKTEFFATDVSPDNCSIALTSFRKLANTKSCSMGQPTCSIQCATAWESFLRDFRDASHFANTSICRLSLSEIQLWPAAPNISYMPSEWGAIGQALSQLCMNTDVFSCSFNYCVLSNSPATSCSARQTALLRPLDCPGFKVTDGVYYTPFLTWISIGYYQQNSLGAAGGLNLESDDEHGTWACALVPECGLVRLKNASRDFSCFRYSHVRGEFHFWGYNSVLKLIPPLIESNVSFCSQDGRLRITNAASGGPVGLVDVIFSWTSNGSIELAGELFNLGLQGCDSFKLASVLEWTLAVSKPGFYLWSGIFSLTQLEYTVGVALLPVMKTSSGSAISMVLSWNENPDDFDLWLILPNISKGWGGVARLNDGRYAINWRDSNISNSDECIASGCAYIDFTQDVRDGFGPETIVMGGNLIDGTYSVYVNLHLSQGTPGLKLESLAYPLLEVYSENSDGIALKLEAGTRTSGQPTLENYWWHAFDFKVRANPANVSQARACMSMSIVDSFVQGYEIVDKDTGTIDGVIAAGVRSDNDTTLFCTTEAGSSKGMALLYMEARSAVDEATVLGNAIFYIRPSPENVLKTVRVSQNVFPRTGVELLFGKYLITMVCKGYVSQNQTIEVSADTSRIRVFYLIPTSIDKSYMYAALRWPKSPSSLDLMVMPLGMDPNWVDESQQPIGDPRSIARPYAGRDITTISWYDASTSKTKTVISVKRYEGTHGIGGNDGPQVISLHSAIPGQYRVYVAVPPLAKCIVPTTERLDGNVDPVFQADDDISVDIYIRDEVQETVKFDRSGGKWWYVGYFFVFAESDRDPVWISTSQILLQDPLTLHYGMVQLLLVDAVSFTPSTDYSDVKYTAYISGMCECPEGTTVCNCFGNIAISGLVGPDESPCDSNCVEDAEWMQDPINALYLPRDRSVYTIKVTKPGYVDRVVPVDAWMNSVARIVMVPIPRPGELRIVLSWGQAPLDLDLWAIPVGDIAQYTYWASQGPHSGVRLDTDSRDGYGPESITFTADTLQGTYRIAVNVYSYEGSAECNGTNRCEFGGGEIVEFFESTGLVKTSTMYQARPGSSWWLAGLISMPAQGTYEFNEDEETTKTTCTVLMTDTAGVCRGSYCCNGCNSNCGDCNAACGSTIQVQIELTDALKFDSDSDFSDVSYVVYTGARACNCLAGSRTCNCSGEPVGSGEIGFDLKPCKQRTLFSHPSCPDEVWSYAFNLYQGADDELYSILLKKRGYMDRVTVIPASSDAKALVVMVRIPPKGELLVLLTWASSPADLDLWVIQDDKVNATYWNSPGPNRGIKLDRDATEGFGPETTTFKNLSYVPVNLRTASAMVAVNVYTYDGVRENMCTGADRCRFNGGEIVEFFENSGLKQKVVLNDPTAKSGSWWVVGSVRRQGSGFVLNTTAISSVASSTCDMILEPKSLAQRCKPEGYCCDVCTSKCGSCVCPS